VTAPPAPVAAGDLIAGARLLARLPGFLRHPVSLAAARDRVATRLAGRATDFVALVRDAVLPDPGSPWRRLLAHAGCTLGDLEACVRREGLEGALGTLLDAGVYLTLDELKGRRPVIRGALTLAVDPARLANPLARRDLPVHSGGSRSAGTPLSWDLAFVRERSATLRLVYAARGGTRWRFANWGVPGSGAIVHALDTAGFGMPPARWFSQVDPGARQLQPRYRWSPRLLRWGGRLAGCRFPAPEHAPLDAPGPVLGWLRDVLDRGETPHLLSYTTSAVRLAEAAAAAGVDLTGAELTMGGEPVSARRVAAIRRTGARCVPRYAMIEAGLVAEGCLDPGAPDEMHLLADLVAVIQPGRRADPLLADDMLVTSLRRSAPLILINVATGDRVTLGDRRCGCAYEALGWTGRVAGVRSDTTLTAAGMTVADADVAPVLESVLPGRFGGSPSDFQLVEETEGPRPALRLLVHPALGPLDDAAVRSVFLEAVAAVSPAARVAGLAWAAAGVVVVERRPPLATVAGKVLHVHRVRGERDGPLAPERV
jgi:hypothetical protein